MKKGVVKFILFSILILSLAAAVPHNINYQGRLSEYGTRVTGTKTMSFYLWDGSTETALLESQSVSIVDGVYNIDLPIDTDSFDNSSSLYLRIYIEGTALAPDVPILAVPYSLYSEKAVTANNISDVRVTKEDEGTASENIIFNY